MKNKKNTILLGSLFFLALLIGLTFSAISVDALFTAPTNESVQCGTISIDVNTSDVASGSFGINASITTFYYDETLLGNGTSNADGTNFTYSWDTSATAHTAKWNKTIRAQFQNSTAAGFERKNESIYLIRTDNEGPVTTYTSSNTADWGFTSSFVVDVTFNESVGSATIYINQKSYSLTLGSPATSASKTFAEKDLPEQTYDYYVTALDTTSCTNSKTSAIRNVNVDYTTGTKYVPPEEDGEKKPVFFTITETVGKVTKSPWLLFGALALIVVLFTIWYKVLRRK